MKEIALTRGYVTQVDNRFYHFLSKFRWSFKQGYARRTIYKRGKYTTVSMHGEVMRLSGVRLGTQEIDHKDRNRLNNTRRNLRVANDHDQATNRQPLANKLSRHKGVTYHRHPQRWYARLQVLGVRYYLGRFKTEVEAHQAYVKAVKKLVPRFGVR